jgi:hypothetical protein
MRLQEIHTKYKTDKGTQHSYIEFYDAAFSNIRLKTLNVLEIGVLFGGSLKMWEEYFENSNIYGIEDFSQKDGHGVYNHEPINVESIREDLRTHCRIKLFEFSCEDEIQIKNNLSLLKFDIIIDDGSHMLKQQKINIQNYFPLLSDGGIYICEDVQTDAEAFQLKSHFESLFPEKICNVSTLNTAKKSDDRLLVCFN